MKKKGFTMVELLGVIVVLTIIILIAVPAYGMIQQKINEKNRETEIKMLEMYAEKYASENYVNALFKKDLKDIGYINEDDNFDFVKDCQIIQITEENGMPVAHVTSEVLEDESGCNYNLLNSKNGALVIKKYKHSNIGGRGEEISQDEKWVNTDVELVVEFADGSGFDKNKIKNIKWNIDETKAHTCQNANKRDCIIVSSNFLEQKYTAIVEYDDDFKSKFQASMTVYIDKIAPQLSSSDISNSINENGNYKDSNGTKWSQSKSYTPDVYDQQSGIYGYNLITKNSFQTDEEFAATKCSTNKADYSKQPLNFNENGNYKVCVIDNAGNALEKAIKVESIDHTAPKCEHLVWHDNNIWTNRNVEIYATCTPDVENQSGCDKSKYSVISYDPIINPNTTVKTFPSSANSIQVCDNAGNCSTCTKDQVPGVGNNIINVYFDTKAPTCSLSYIAPNTTKPSASNWSRTIRTINANCSDDTGGSGCTENTFSKTYENLNVKDDTYPAKTFYDNAGNSVICPNRADVYLETSILPATITRVDTYWNKVVITFNNGTAISGIQSITGQLNISGKSRIYSSSVTSGNQITINITNSADIDKYGNDIRINLITRSNAGNVAGDSSSDAWVGSKPGPCATTTAKKTGTQCDPAKSCTENGKTNVNCKYTWQNVATIDQSIECGDPYATYGTESRTTNKCCPSNYYELTYPYRTETSECNCNTKKKTITRYYRSPYDGGYECPSRPEDQDCSNECKTKVEISEDKYFCECTHMNTFNVMANNGSGFCSGSPFLFSVNTTGKTKLGFDLNAWVGDAGGGGNCRLGLTEDNDLKLYPYGMDYELYEFSFTNQSNDPMHQYGEIDIPAEARKNNMLIKMICYHSHEEYSSTNIQLSELYVR